MKKGTCALPKKTAPKPEAKPYEKWIGGKNGKP